MLGNLGRQTRRRRKAVENETDTSGGKIRPKDVPPHLQYLIDRGKIDILKEHFDMFDEDMSGLISTDELADFMRSIGHNPVESRLQELVKEFDTDNNGDLSFGEFVQLWYSYLSEAEAEKLMIKKAFEFFDGDQSNSIDFTEFIEAMTTLGDPLSKDECEKFFTLVDKDANGEIDFDEFVEFVCEEGPVFGKGGELQAPSSSLKFERNISQQSRKMMALSTLTGQFGSQHHTRLGSIPDPTASSSTNAIQPVPQNAKQSVNDHTKEQEDTRQGGSDGRTAIEPGPDIPNTSPESDVILTTPRTTLEPPVVELIKRPVSGSMNRSVMGSPTRPAGDRNAGMALPGTIIDTSEQETQNANYSKKDMSCMAGLWQNEGDKNSLVYGSKIGSVTDKGREPPSDPNKHTDKPNRTSSENLIKSAMAGHE